MKHLILVIFNHTHNIIIYIIFDLNNSTIVYPQLILQMPVAVFGLFTAFLVAVPKGGEKKSHVKMTDASFTTPIQSVNKQKRTCLI
jgi:hypothetical protein